MRTFLKNCLNSIAPESLIAVQSIRSRRLSHRLFREWGVHQLNQRLRERLGTSVLEGPFAGLRLPEAAFLEQVGPYLLGTYEQELHPWLHSLLDGNFSEVWDIGSKFGYYAVGIAQRMPTTKVVAFDTDWWARRASADMAKANCLTNVELRKACSPMSIATQLPNSALIISDCEGYERVLFAGLGVPALNSATLLIETHDSFVPGVTEFLRQRFGESHHVAQIANGERFTGVDLSFIEPSQQTLATTELRAQELWLLLTPKNN